MNAFRRWMDAATAAEKIALAKLAKTTVGTLYQIAGSYRTGGELRVEPGLASRLELGTKMLVRRGLKSVKRTELSPVCGACEYAKRHK